MMKFNNKKIIIFGVFTLVLMLSLYYVLNDNNIGKKVVINDIESNSHEISLGDDDEDGCATSKTTYSYVNGGTDTVTGGATAPSGCVSSAPTPSATSADSYKICTRGSSVYSIYVYNWSVTTYNKTSTKKCTSCSSGYYLSEDSCLPIKVASVEGGDKTIYLAADEEATFTFTAKSDPSDATGFAPDWSLSSTNGATGAGSGTTYTLTASGTKKGTESSCASTTYTVTATAGGVSKSAKATVCKYCSAWKGPHKAYILSTTQRNTSKPEKGCYYYEGEQKVTGGWLYTAYYTRCCSKPKSDFGACYGNHPKYLGLATDAGWQEKATSNRPYKYEGIKEDDCEPINVNVCDAKPTSPLPITENTSKCEDTKELKFNDTTICSDADDTTNSNFYTITCDRSIKTKFDFGDDENNNTSHVLYRGQGFKFGIKVTSIHTCTGKFNKDTWTNVYNRYLRKIGFISESLLDYVKNYNYSGWSKAVEKLDTTKEIKSEVFELWNILKGLRDLVVNDYLGYTPKNQYDEQATITLKYNVNGASKTITEDLVINEDDYTEGEYKRTNSDTKFDLTNKLKNVPESFVLTNENSPRVVKLIPKKVYVDKYIGQEVNSDSTNIDGGNKIYVDYNIDSTKNNESYPISISLTGLGPNKSVVNDDKCDFKILNEDILYRPIDVSNPFINSNWEIGKNWLNDKFSFTNTIKSNVWSLDSLIKLDISNSEIDDIKSSNKNYSDKYPYLGLCERINSNSQDKITNKICNALKKAIDQFQ